MPLLCTSEPTELNLMIEKYMMLMFLKIYFIGSTSTFFITVDTNCAARAIGLVVIDLYIFSSLVTDDRDDKPYGKELCILEVTVERVDLVLLSSKSESEKFIISSL